MPESKEHVKRSRGIYLLPNLFTTAALFSGFYGILAAMNGRFESAAIAISVAMVLDGLDGRVARMTNTQTPFGAEYDSLSDMVAFGLAPSLVVYVWSLSGLGKLGWLAAFIFTAGAALRLARFNTQANSTSKKHFVGLPIPGAALMVATTVMFFYRMGGSGPTKHFLLLAMTYVLGFLMVSSIGLIRFPDFYTRAHAVGKSDTLGITLTLAGLAVYNGLELSTVKLIIIILFVLIANPTATHAVTRAALRFGLSPWTRSKAARKETKADKT